MTRPQPLSLLITLSTAGMLMVIAIAVRYSYSSLTRIEAIAGLLILLVVTGFFGWYRRHAVSTTIASLNPTLWRGILLGGFWLVEISINNFIAPPLPARDIIDNIFWAVIALAILGFAVLRAYDAKSINAGALSGLWIGLCSGLVACCTALCVILFAMPFILRDPLNDAEWIARGASSSAPGMDAYFAFETFAGAFLHLVILGIVMGGLLGVMGGLTGRAARWMRRR